MDTTVGTLKFTFSSEHAVASWIFSNNESNFAQLFRQQFKRFSDESWMSAALSVFKLIVQNVHQLQQHMIEPEHFFSIQSWARAAVRAGAPSCWKMKLSNSRCLQSLIDLAAAWWRSNWCSLWPFRPKVKLCIRLKYQRGYFLCQNRSLITCSLWKMHIWTEFINNNVANSNSYNFWMQPNIAMKFAGYMARILLCKNRKFCEKISYNSRDIEFFLGDYFFGAPCRAVLISGVFWLTVSILFVYLSFVICLFCICSLYVFPD